MTAIAWGASSAGGVVTVFLAHDLRHDHDVAI